MLDDITIDRVYLAKGSTDLRKSIDGLAVLVQEGFNLDPKEKGERLNRCLLLFLTEKCLFEIINNTLSKLNNFLYPFITFST